MVVTRALSPVEELGEAHALLEVVRVDADITNKGEPSPGLRPAMTAHVIRGGITNAIIHVHPSWARIRLSPDGIAVTNDSYSAAYVTSSTGSGSGLAGLSELIDGEGTPSWGASGFTWTFALFSGSEPNTRSS